MMPCSNTTETDCADRHQAERDRALDAAHEQATRELIQQAGSFDFLLDLVADEPAPWLRIGLRHFFPRMPASVEDTRQAHDSIEIALNRRATEILENS